MTQTVDFTTLGGTFEEDVDYMKNVVQELTGEWIQEIGCDDIQSPHRGFYDELVYFGDAEDLQPGGIAEHVI